MKIQLFATLREQAKAGTVDVAVDGALAVSALRLRVAEQHPALAGLVPQALVAVNQEFAFDEDVVTPRDEVALFPPVSGG